VVVVVVEEEEVEEDEGLDRGEGSNRFWGEGWW